jgi:hypothetical protein
MAMPLPNANALVIEGLLARLASARAQLTAVRCNLRDKTQERKWNDLVEQINSAEVECEGLRKERV